MFTGFYQTEVMIFKIQQYTLSRSLHELPFGLSINLCHTVPGCCPPVVYYREYMKKGEYYILFINSKRHAKADLLSKHTFSAQKKYLGKVACLVDKKKGF